METAQKEHKKKLSHIRLDFEQMQAFYNRYNKGKVKRDSVGWLKAYLVYIWIFTWQLVTKVGYGRVRKQDVFDEIERDLLEPKPHMVVRALIRAGMVVWGRNDYNGKVNYCLQCTYLNERNRISNTAISEETITVVESALPKQSNPSPTKAEAWEEPKMSVGVVWFPGGHYGYQDENGNIQKDWDGSILYIPKEAAFNRPSIKHVYDFDVYRWCLPEEVTIPELEF